MDEEMLEKTEDEQNADEQAHKKLMEQVKAAITVHRQKNRGSIPSLQEITQLLEQSPEQAEDDGDLPKCLKYLAYFGKDSEKPMYYEDPEGMCFFDTHEGQWSSEKPKHIDGLNSREIQNEDMFDMVLHGVMDDEDYSSLEKAGMVDERAGKLYHKISSLKSHAAELQKSVDVAFGDEEEPDSFLDEERTEELPDLFDVSTEDSGEAGQDLIAQIMEQAMSPAQNPKLQEFIQAEIQKYMQSSAPQAPAVPEASPAPVPAEAPVA